MIWFVRSKCGNRVEIPVSSATTNAVLCISLWHSCCTVIVLAPEWIMEIFSHLNIMPQQICVMWYLFYDICMDEICDFHLIGRNSQNDFLER